MQKGDAADKCQSDPTARLPPAIGTPEPFEDTLLLCVRNTWPAVFDDNFTFGVDADGNGRERPGYLDGVFHNVADRRID